MSRTSGSAAPCGPPGCFGGRAALPRVRRVRPDRHARRGGPRPGPDRPARDHRRPGRRAARLRLGRVGGAGGARPGATRLVGCAARPGRPGLARAGGRRGGRPGLVAGADPGCLPDRLRDGARRAPAARPCGRAPAASRTASGRAGRRPDRRRPGRHPRPARCDRILVVRRSALLRPRERLGADPGPVGPAGGPARSGRMPAAGRDPAVALSRGRCRSGAGRRAVACGP